MSYDITGSLHKVFDIEVKSNNFKSVEFVIIVAGQYPQFIKFQLVQDRCELVERLVDGDEIKVYFDLRGREWQGKYFTTLQAWKIERISGGTKSLTQDPGAAPSLDEESDMPF